MSMNERKHAKIKSTCFVNSRDIFEWFAAGKTNKEIIELLLNRAETKSALYFSRGFRAWIKDLGFENHVGLRNHILEFGLPEGRKPITKKMLEDQTIEVALPKPEKIKETVKVSHETISKTEEKPKEVGGVGGKKLFNKTVSVDAGDDAESNNSNFMPEKKRTVKSIEDRVLSKIQEKEK